MLQLEECFLKIKIQRTLCNLLQAGSERLESVGSSSHSTAAARNTESTESDPLRRNALHSFHNDLRGLDSCPPFISCTITPSTPVTNTIPTPTPINIIPKMGHNNTHRKMLARGARGMPEFSQNKPGDLRHFLEQLEDTFKDAGITVNQDKKLAAIKYVDSDTFEQ